MQLQKYIDRILEAECSRWVGLLQECKQDRVKCCHCLAPSAGILVFGRPCIAGLKTSLPELRAYLFFFPALPLSDAAGL